MSKLHRYESPATRIVGTHLLCVRVLQEGWLLYSQRVDDQRAVTHDLTGGGLEGRGGTCDVGSRVLKRLYGRGQPLLHINTSEKREHSCAVAK